MTPATDLYLADRPLESSKNDRFRRSEFARQIAKTIAERKDSDSLVVGLYGVWGDGKTSVLHFMKETLLNEHPQTLALHFNPWRFPDEKTLLENFFHQLAVLLQKATDEKAGEKPKKLRAAPEKTLAENLGDMVKKYGDLVAQLPVVGEAAKSLGGILAEVSPEELKERIEKRLREVGKRVVIFIDDIDRLERNEIHAVFRLVKLTADFPFTSYVLAFDQQKVAAALGERFGEGSREDGFQFLEKIIQVPLLLPKIHFEALREYCYDILNQALLSNNIELEKDEAQRFVQLFESNLLPDIETPRAIVRYRNIIGFSLPLLKGEVNLTDLMLIEAVRVLFPDFYEFIRKNSNLFVRTYSSLVLEGGRDYAAIKKSQEKLENALGKYTEDQKTHLKSLITALFPTLRGVFENVVHSDDQYEEWFSQKRIGSPQYVERYFTYAVQKGELSDIVFQGFLDAIPNAEVKSVIKRINEICSNNSPSAFLTKLIGNQSKLSWKDAKKLVFAMAETGIIFEETPRFNFFVTTPIDRLSYFMVRMLLKCGDAGERLETARQLLENAKSIDLAQSLSRKFLLKNTRDEVMFAGSDATVLQKTFVHRILDSCGNIPVYEQCPNFLSRHFFYLWSCYDRGGLIAYLKKSVDGKPEKALSFIRNLTPMSASSIHPEYYLSDWDKDYFRWFEELTETDWLYDLVILGYGKEIKNGKVSFHAMSEPGAQTDINILRQFAHFYEIARADEKSYPPAKDSV